MVAGRCLEPGQILAFPHIVNAVLDACDPPMLAICMRLDHAFFHAAAPRLYRELVISDALVDRGLLHWAVAVSASHPRFVPPVVELSQETAIRRHTRRVVDSTESKAIHTAWLAVQRPIALDTLVVIGSAGADLVERGPVFGPFEANIGIAGDVITRPGVDETFVLPNDWRLDVPRPSWFTRRWAVATAETDLALVFRPDMLPTTASERAQSPEHTTMTVSWLNSISARIYCTVESGYTATVYGVDTITLHPSHPLQRRPVGASGASAGAPAIQIADFLEASSMRPHTVNSWLRGEREIYAALRRDGLAPLGKVKIRPLADYDRAAHGEPNGLAQLVALAKTIAGVKP